MFRNDFLRTYRRIVIFGGMGIVLILIIFLGIVPLIDYLNRPAYVDILIAPVEAKIMIDGKEYRNATYELEPGEYKAEISREGYKSKEINFIVNHGETIKLYTYLDPEDGDFSDYEEKKNVDSLKALLRMNGYNEEGEEIEDGFSMIDEDKTANDFINKVTIAKEMPIYMSVCGKPAKRTNCNSISVNYDYDYRCDGNRLCLIIRSRERALSEVTLDEVKKGVESLGRKFSEYKYVYDQNVNM
ncbi:hypothetical protein IKG33_03305 [Candidatus Saccharibacteria bacterium]|nr:hypothetical protein [Candidatus Saccharibacteria bacterium]